MPDQNTETRALANGEKRSSRNHDEENGPDGRDAGPACQSCRKRKAKCSRQQPCSQCDTLGIQCVYDESKLRPGLRTGAIESLSQRVASLEQMFIGQSMLLRPLLERAFQDYKLSSSRPASSSSCSDFTADSQALKRKLISIAESSYPDDSAPPVLDESARPTAKRSRVENEVATSHNPVTNIPTFDPLIPPQDILVRLVDLYFLRLHPWIPVLHVRSFREQMKDTSQHPKLASIFHAIVSVCARFSIDPYYTSHSDLRGLCKRCRDTVILKSMETVTVQNLQALVIVAFDIIGSGRGPMAWSVVNSLTRSVEQLQLSVEDGEEDSLRNGDEYLFRRMSFLKSVNNWVESEERRRVFWNVFLMDRFCSIGTGWNNSLTSADVRRRLPCEGAIWEAGSPVITPYFGIGESMTPAQQGLTPTTERFTANENEADSIGGFAFCIEATESLNLVTKFFLQHGINFRSLQSIQIWLMRFKELDLRLVRWRLFLPPKWRTACALNEDGNMDPNMTLAHITHNAAVIQLHQSIAYPAKQWTRYSATLPSSASAETCLSAAREIIMIAKEYLGANYGITNPQFSFCLFIAGRVLLTHSARHAQPFVSEICTTIEILHDIARRWSGEHYTGVADSQGSLASRFADRLEATQASVRKGDRNISNPVLDIRQPAYSEQVEATEEVAEKGGRHGATPAYQNQHNTVTRSAPEQNERNNITPHGVPGAADFEQSPDSISLAFPPLPTSFQQIDFSSDTFDPISQMGDLQSIDALHTGNPYIALEDFNNMFGDPSQESFRISTYADVHSSQEASIE